MPSTAKAFMCTAKPSPKPSPPKGAYPKPSISVTIILIYPAHLELKSSLVWLIVTAKSPFCKPKPAGWFLEAS